MEKPVNGGAAVPSRNQELLKELAQLRVRCAEIASELRREHGMESAEVRLSEEIAHAVQCLEAQLFGCSSARFEH